jgi:hypothetical protein
VPKKRTERAQGVGPDRPRGEHGTPGPSGRRADTAGQVVALVGVDSRRKGGRVRCDPGPAQTEEHAEGALKIGILEYQKIRKKMKIN